MKDNVLKKASKCAENKTTSRKELGTSLQNACSEADEGLKAREEENREKEKKLFRNQLGIVCSYQNTLLTQTCHGANICSQVAESVRVSVYCTGTPRVDLARWT